VTNENMKKLGAKLELWVVYKHPRDYPNSWVVRRQWTMDNGQILAEATPRAVGPSLEAVRTCIPDWLACLGRETNDDPAIHEVWI
jgi:hypothetical protein